MFLTFHPERHLSHSDVAVIIQWIILFWKYTISTCGYSDIFHRPFLGVQNLEFQYFFFFFFFFFFFGGGGGGGGGFRNEYFSGYEDFVDIFCGSSQNWTGFRGHFYAF